MIITLVNLSWTFREPLLRNSQVRSFLEDIGQLEATPDDAYKDLQNIHLVSRDLHTHPARTGILVLSFTFVSRASLDQPYPDIELALFDASSKILAIRTFQPREYLPAFDPALDELTPNVHVPVLLEFEDPGVAASGFELNFK